MRLEALDMSASVIGIIAPFRAQADVRYYLTGIYIELPAEGPGVIAVATDGHRLVAMHDKTATALFSPGEQGVILNIPHGLERACKTSSRTREGGERRLVLENGHLAVRVSFEGKSALKTSTLYISPEQPEVEGQYPDWRRVVPPVSHLTPGLPAIFQSCYLREFAELGERLARASGGVWHGSVRFYSRKKDPMNASAVARFGASDDVVAIIMPMRDKTPEQIIPSWAARRAKAKA